MARDGTARGSNIKVNAGRKSKALAEKMATGNPGGRKLKIIDLPDGAELEGEDIPEPSSYIKSKQKAVGEFDAEHIYRYIYLYLKEKGCDKLVSKHLVEQYAMSVSRLMQCEEAISEYGFRFQASDHRSRLCKSICRYGSELPETGKHNMVSDFPSGKGELLTGL